MTPKELERFEQMARELAELKNKFASLESASLIPFDVEQALISRLRLPEVGYYTPTLSNVTNIDSSTASLCQYVVLGDVVVVSGKVNVNPTAAAPTVSQLGISLPLRPKFAADKDCAGTAACATVASESAAIIADTTNSRAEMSWLTNSAGAHDMFFIFMYRTS